MQGLVVLLQRLGHLPQQQALARLGGGSAFGFQLCIEFFKAWIVLGAGEHRRPQGAGLGVLLATGKHGRRGRGIAHRLILAGQWQAHCGQAIELSAQRVKLSTRVIQVTAFARQAGLEQLHARLVRVGLDDVADQRIDQGLLLQALGEAGERELRIHVGRQGATFPQAFEYRAGALGVLAATAERDQGVAPAARIGIAQQFFQAGCSRIGATATHGQGGLGCGQRE